MPIVTRVKKLLRLHPRLLLAAAVGLLVGGFLPDEPLQRAIVGWNIGVWLYLGMIWYLMARAKPDEVKKFAEQEDESATMVLMLVCIAAMASLAAIVLQLGAAKGLDGTELLLHYLLTVATVLGSWFLVGTIFTVHYTKLFYTDPSDGPSLKFPDEKETPDYWDFLYFSFTIPAAVQTSDVAIMTTTMRKAVLGQSVLAFPFNAAILGLSINIAASLIGG